MIAILEQTIKVSLFIHQLKKDRQVLFLYRTICIDAHENQCVCHPKLFVRHLNLLRKKANIKPRLHHVNDEQFMLFTASRDIGVNDALKFASKPFVAEESELDWV
ncbi:hypothetical protein Q7C36_019350 [Tachysurus vachellii]|uniref:Uncharacterized protein n=1 Tax=Tachysurus vachellii TaxID=175792 RepID=A0AA88SAM6_TACVA|nr:hypothetical protein Q7C36_019350 [Tachysurus vachellii]